MIKAVTFDFWNTLYADNNFEARLNKRVEYLVNELLRLGYQRSGVEVEKAVEVTGKKWMHEWSAQSKSFTPMDIVRSILEDLDLKLPEEICTNLKNGLAAAALKAPPVIVNGVKSMLEEISKDFILGIISDTAATPGSVLKEIMKKDDIEKYFSVFVFSDELTTTKPDKQNFLKVLNSINVESSQAAHVGDMERTDIKGAKQLGMKAVLFCGVNNKDVNSTSADLVVTSFDNFRERLKEL